MHRKSTWLNLLGICLCGALSAGCVLDPRVNLAASTADMGTHREFNLGIADLKDVIFSLPWSRYYISITPRTGTDSFTMEIANYPATCILDLVPIATDRTGLNLLCNMRHHENNERWYVDDMIGSAVAQRRLNRPAPAAGIAKEDLNNVVQAAVKGALSAQNPEAAAPAIASDVDRPKYSEPENPDRFAVIIGVEKYANLPKAKFAGHDAQAVRDHLQALGVPQRNIFFAADQDATRASIVKAVHTWLPNHINGNSTVFFYYSGHGAPDPESQEAYLLPIDGDPEALADTAYPLKSLYHNLSQLKAKQIVVALDSCFSGAGGRSVLANGVRPLVTKVEIPEPTSGNIISFSAARADQISGTVDEQGHGVFTYYFLKGLNGGAVDENGSVSVQALYNYLKPKVADAARLHNRDQTPGLLVGSGSSAELKLR